MPVSLLPDDPSDRQLVAHVHPPDWVNPTPASRYNLVVVGAGTAGLVCAAGAAGLGARVALVERDLLGGDCLNVGCVPSKALLRSARAAAAVRDAGAFGVHVPPGVQDDFPAVMERLRLSFNPTNRLSPGKMLPTAAGCGMEQRHPGRRAALGKGPVYLYYFTWETPVQGGKLKSPHTMEIPFAFDNVKISARMTGGGADAMALADKVSDTWIAFARTGNPNNPKMPHWPAFNAKDRPTMVINNDSKVVNDPLREQRIAMFRALDLA